jgi:hypothetical protein
MRAILFSLFLLPSMTLACTPPADMKPFSVEELYRSSAFVVHAEVRSVKRSAEDNVAEIKIIEQFKGDAISSIVSSANSCGLSLSAGETRIFFLTQERSGHALAYPWQLSQSEILVKLRSLKH